MDTKQPTIGISVSPLADWEASHQVSPDWPTWRREQNPEITPVQQRYLDELDLRVLSDKMLGYEPMADTPERRRTRNLLALMLHDAPVGDLRIARNREDD